VSNRPRALYDSSTRVCAVSLRFPSSLLPSPCRHEEADIRIRLNNVSRQAARLSVDGAKVRSPPIANTNRRHKRLTNSSFPLPAQVYLENISSQDGQVVINGSPMSVDERVEVEDHSVFAIGGRAFRFDYGEWPSSQAPRPPFPHLSHTLPCTARPPPTHAEPSYVPVETQRVSTLCLRRVRPCRHHYM
jgi:hypothetical protein